MFQVFHDVSILNSVAALLPGILILIVIYKQDKIEKEPIGLLVLLVFLGMLSAFVTMRIGSPVATYISKTFIAKHWTFLIIKTFLIIALLEEGLKYLSIKLPTWNNVDFDYRFDGIVYGSCVGVGFAIYESFTHGGHGSLLIMIRQALFSVSGHLTYGIIMGLLIAVALSRENHKDYSGSKRFRLLAFLIPWFIHGAFDFVGELIDIGVLPLIINYVFAIVEFIIAIIILKISSEKDESILPEKKKWWQ